MEVVSTAASSPHRRSSFGDRVLRAMGVIRAHSKDEWHEDLDHARKKTTPKKNNNNKPKGGVALLPDQFKATYTGTINSNRKKTHNNDNSLRNQTNEDEINGTLTFQKILTTAEDDSNHNAPTCYTITGVSKDKSGSFTIKEGRYLPATNTFYWLAEPEDATFQATIFVTGTTKTTSVSPTSSSSAASSKAAAAGPSCLTFNGEWRANEGNREGLLSFQIPI